MKAIKLAIFLFLLSCAVFSATARGVEIKPSIVLMPASQDELFSLDLVISEDPGIFAYAFKATIVSVSGSGPGVLTFDVAASQAVAAETAYWVYGNSDGATAKKTDDDTYIFGDNPRDPVFEALVIDDIVARYAFTWDGVEEDYTFTLALDTTNSYVLLEDFISKEALQLPAGNWYDYPIISADGSSFTVHIPEPVSLVLLGLGGLVLLKQRRP